MDIRLYNHQRYNCVYTIISRVENYLQEVGYKEEDLVEAGYDKLGFPQVILSDNSKVRFYSGVRDGYYDGYHIMEIEKKYDNAKLYTHICHCDGDGITDEVMSLLETKDGLYVSIYRPIEVHGNKISYHVDGDMPTYFYTRENLNVDANTSIISDIVGRTDDLNSGFDIAEAIGKKYEYTQRTNNRVPYTYVSPISRSVLTENLVAAAIIANELAEKLIKEKAK